jgi:hypothetical protein
MAGIRFWPRCSRRVRAFNAPVGGVGAEAASSGRPRARRSFARGGVQPSSEAEFCPRGPNPRARRSFGGTAPGPSSEAEICPRGAEADHLMGRWGCLGRGLPLSPRRDCARCALQFVSSFVFYYLRKNGFLPDYWRTLVAIPDTYRMWLKK